VDLVIAPRAVDSWLRVDSQVSKLIHLGQLIVDNGSLGRSGLRRPRKLLEITSTESGKELADVGEGCWVAPKLVSIGLLQYKLGVARSERGELTLIPMDTG